ncbi:MAG: division/cell wall cluster transcriptional repressor MraZ [candidate division NC10 bacterium]|jgi:MraZ protein|nr:division/cell wall cluster transcriptional repressor MraZ [candidate division NC10 bacterium]HZX60723.1 division/cell wall cluster transcriptional repressor MraZ [Candidatus Methylomirabilis sp.]
MRFIGRFPHTIDEKGRLSIPSRFRQALKQRKQRILVLTDFDTCVTAYPLDVWARLEEKIQNQSNFEKDVRAFLRLFYSGAGETPVDGQGRILIPPQHREKAGLRRDVVIVGALNRIEIWDRERWEQFLSTSPVTFDDVASKLAQLGI